MITVVMREIEVIASRAMRDGDGSDVRDRAMVDCLSRAMRDA